ncbi:MAG: glycoside hydrolase family 16 protein, partial [Acidobacteriota bacterium]|nr:glycoside hydrolase family 16 protein [Acidobacteriota bacterium]
MKISATLFVIVLCVVAVFEGRGAGAPPALAETFAASRRPVVESPPPVVESLPVEPASAESPPVGPASVETSSVAPEASPVRESPSQVLFDDFNYSDRRALSRHGWIVRNVAGWPGVPGAKWWPEGVTFLKDEAAPRNRILRMTSSTDGTGEHTRQTQICHQRKYFEGTYAARVRFTDAPLAGPGGDQLVESFYTISPLKAPMDADYSELDFEYLPN